MKKILVIIIPLIILAIFFYLETRPSPYIGPPQYNGYIEEQIMEDLIYSDRPMSFPTPEAQMRTNAEELIHFGIKNLNNNTLNYQIKLQDLNTDNEGNPGICSPEEYIISNKENQCFTFVFDDSIKPLAPDQVAIESIKINSQKRNSTYMFKLIIWDVDNDKQYASKTFFIQVIP